MTESFILSALQRDPQYLSQNSHLFESDRILFLDGMEQSTGKSSVVCDESFIHPSMFTHLNPKRVAILGGGTSASLREVLKHNTIEKIVMIESDPKLIEMLRTHLSEWNNCSNLVGVAPKCMDDPRVEIHAVDPVRWFIDQYGEEGAGPTFDVIFMDSL